MGAFYHGITKKLIVGFGALFSDIHIIRRQGDTITGEVKQDIRVPISYAPKDKWYVAIMSNPTKDKSVKTTLPRMSFEMSSLQYDPTRKTTRTSTIQCTDEDGNAIQVSTPAPWNYEFILYLVANSQEDIYQMLEQILPLFNPDYTIKVRTIPQLGIVQNVPISLNSVAIQDNFDGDYTDTRLLVYTLSFTAKANLYGEVVEAKSITDIDFNASDGEDAHVTYTFDKNGKSTTVDWNLNVGTVVTHVDPFGEPPKSPTVVITEEGQLVREMKID